MTRYFLLPLLLPSLFAAEPIPEDRGTVGLYQSIRKLGTAARVLYITAHPDDEDGAAITALSRALAVDVTLLSLTRGEGGANLVGPETFDSLGVLRSLELAKSAQYYGCRIRFTSFADYGYSKNVEEAFRNWDKEKILSEVVRAVREERPHVIISRWQGTPADGHGQHSAAGVLAQLAFDAAGDPARFPEQLQGGVKPWKPVKLYSGNWKENDDWTIGMNSGVWDSFYGRTYAQVALEGLRFQHSQGAGKDLVDPGPRMSYYKRLRGPGSDKEDSFFDGIDEAIVPPDDLKKNFEESMRNYTPHLPAASSRYLAIGLGAARKLGLDRTEQLWEEALNRSLGIELEAIVQSKEPILSVTPGQTFEIKTTYHNFTHWPARVTALELSTPPGWAVEPLPGARFRVTVSSNPEYSKVNWHRDSAREMQYKLDPPAAKLAARLKYVLTSQEVVVEREVLTMVPDSLGRQRLQPLVVAPAVSIRFGSNYGFFPLDRSSYDLVCFLHNFGKPGTKGGLSLELPPNWKSEPATANFEFSRGGEEARISFRVTPNQVSAGEFPIKAVARVDGKDYRTEFTSSKADDLDVLWSERPAVHRVVRVDVKTARGRRVGYIMGTGDEVPEALAQLGFDIQTISDEQIANGNLNQYITIILGVRAYAARDSVRRFNNRLLQYVNNGGVLIVQYNTTEYDHNFGPYPYQMGAQPEEVTDESTPVAILEPADPILNAPNKITGIDFNGWIEQRGSKFLSGWDKNYKALLETKDPGQAPQKGGLLVARHGKGLYVYCAYALYRQLPFGVPGAARLLANLASLKP